MRVCLDSQKLTRAIQVRGLHLTDLARLTGLTLPTVSAATAGRRVNITNKRCAPRANKGLGGGQSDAMPLYETTGHTRFSASRPPT